MKYIAFLGLVFVLFISCNKQETRYTQQSKEIDIYKKVIEAYENQDWETMATYYAGTAKILNNVLEKDAQNFKELIAQNREDAELFYKWDFVDTESEYEMVVTDDGETWVNYWGLWKGVLKENNKVYEIPTHITARFINGKIVHEAGYWDLSKMMQDIQVTQAESLRVLENNSGIKMVSGASE